MAWLGWLALAWLGWLALVWLSWLALAWLGLGPMGPVPMGQGPGPDPWAQWARAQWARGPGRVGLAWLVGCGLVWLGPNGPGPMWAHMAHWGPFGFILGPYWAHMGPIGPNNCQKIGPVGDSYWTCGAFLLALKNEHTRQPWEQALQSHLPCTAGLAIEAR